MVDFFFLQIAALSLGNSGINSTPMLLISTPIIFVVNIYMRGSRRGSEILWKIQFYEIHIVKYLK